MTEIELIRRPRDAKIPIEDPSEDYFLLVMNLAGYPLDKLKPIRFYNTGKTEWVVYSINTLTLYQFIRVLEEWMRVFMIIDATRSHPKSSNLMFSNWYDLLITMCPLKGFNDIQIESAAEWWALVSSLKKHC